MPTTKQRIDLSVDEQTYKALRSLARARKESISVVSVGLIREGLKRKGDLYFSQVADQRLEEEQDRLSHQEAWE